MSRKWASRWRTLAGWCTALRRRRTAVPASGWPVSPHSLRWTCTGAGAAGTGERRAAVVHGSGGGMQVSRMQSATHACTARAEPGCHVESVQVKKGVLRRGTRKHLECVVGVSAVSCMGGHTWRELSRQSSAQGCVVGAFRATCPSDLDREPHGPCPLGAMSCIGE